MKALLGGSEISSGEGRIEASYCGYITVCRHHALPQLLKRQAFEAPTYVRFNASQEALCTACQGV
jgi:hypothetical protein